MAKTTVSFFKRPLAVEGVAVPDAGDGHVGDDTLTAAGAADAAPEGARLARIATDTAYTSDVYGSGTSTLHPANSAGFFPIRAGQVVTFVAA